MKLYFYGLNSDGIFVTEVEVIEKPKTYYPVDKKRGFPNCMSFVRKEGEGKITDYYENIFLTKPNFDYAKEKFREAAEKELKSAKEKFEIGLRSGRKLK